VLKSFKNESSGRIKRLLWLLLSCFSLVLVFVFLFHKSNEIGDIRLSRQTLEPTVTVIMAYPKNRPFTIAATGMTSSRWHTEIVATVEGRVVDLGSSIEVGTKVKEGDLLVQLNTVSYQVDVDRAKSQLSAAKTNLARVRHEQTIALKMSEGRLKTALGRHELQVESAHMELIAMESALQLARQRLADTRIVAPFDALVLEHSLAPGQWVGAGSSLFQLASSRQLDVTMDLSERQWRLMEQLKSGWRVEVVAREGRRFLAEVRYITPSLDTNTHLRGLVLKVNLRLAAELLLAGEQVGVEFSGLLTTPVFSIPSSSLTHDTMVWTVGEDNLLQQESVELLQGRDGSSLVRFQNDPLRTRKVVRYPLRSMLPGLKVQTKTAVTVVVPS
jgi:RND family efflux transporter MFP subunit